MHAMLCWEWNASFLFTLTGTQGFIPWHCVKACLWYLQGSSSQFSLWSQLRLLYSISQRCLAPNGSAVSPCSRIQSWLMFQTSRRSWQVTSLESRDCSRPGRCSAPGAPHPVAIGTYNQVMLRCVPGQNTKAFSETNNQIICLLNNVSMARGTCLHSFVMCKKLLVFSIYEEGESWLLAMMYQESGLSSIYFPLWRFQWFWLSSKSCLFSQLIFFKWWFYQCSSTKKLRTSKWRSRSLSFADVLHFISLT